MAASGGGDMMINIHDLFFSFAAGTLIGLFYFGGLWWTLRRMPVLHEPIIWVIGSFLIRAALSLLGFYFAAGGQWIRILICLLGFFLVRIIWVTPLKVQSQKLKVRSER
jgi:F1F0 ATPase subunit 2